MSAPQNKISFALLTNKYYQASITSMIMYFAQNPLSTPIPIWFPIVHHYLSKANAMTLLA
jgi:hypothetical protein